MTTDDVSHACVFFSQEPRHLQYVADLEDLNVYTVVNSRKLYGAPADFTFCIKVSASSRRVRACVCVSFEDELLYLFIVCACSCACVCVRAAVQKPRPSSGPEDPVRRERADTNMLDVCFQIVQGFFPSLL